MEGGGGGGGGVMGEVLGRAGGGGGVMVEVLGRARLTICQLLTSSTFTSSHSDPPG